MLVLLLGKEVFNFFTIYNVNGLISILFFCILIFFVILKVLNLKFKYSINSYRDFLKLLDNSNNFFNNKLFLIIINIFLASTFYLMIVGLSTLFNYQFNISKILATFFIIILCYHILKKDNLKFIYIINSILIPILIIFIMFLSISNINFTNINFYENTNNFIYAIFYGLLYFSYNSLLIIPILFSINTKNIKENFFISLLFSFFIFLLTLFINLLLLTFFNYINNIDLPILAICNSKGSIHTFLYFFIILSAILTTLFSSGFSFIENIKEKNKNTVLILFLFASFIFNFFSFSNLINIFYSIFRNNWIYSIISNIV